MLLINPPSNNFFSFPVASLGYIASLLEKNGHEVTMIDAHIDRHYKKKILTALECNEYVGLTTNIVKISGAIQIADFIRKNRPDAKIIMGGPYASVEFEKLIPEHADIIVHGEGEYTLLDIVQGNEELKDIKGISYWDGNCIKTTPLRPNIEDLDSLPFPAWHLFDLRRYPTVAKKWPVVPIITSRGCPYKCINCTHVIHGYKYRYRSPENVVDEIEYMVDRFGIKEFQIWDDNFTLLPERTRKICELIIERKIKIFLSAPNGIRADIGDLELFKLMKKAGFFMVSLAVESGDQENVNKLGKKQDLERLKATVKMLNEVKIKINLFVILGLPFDSKETMRKSIDFVKKLKVEMVQFFTCAPFPGTELFEIIKKEGRLLYDPEVFHPGFQRNEPVFEMPNLSSKDVKRMARRAYMEFYFRPGQIYRFLTKGFTFRKSLGGFVYFVTKTVFSK